MPPAAAIDIGTNSILLLVADAAKDGAITPILDECRITRLGKGVDSQGSLSPEAIEASLDALRVFTEMARSAGADEINAVGTSALRDARNSQLFLGPAAKILGTHVRVITGEDEAGYSWASVASDASLGVHWPLCMADVGGGSTELVLGDNKGSKEMVSIDIGAVRLTERCLRSDPYTHKEIEAARAMARQALGNPAKSRQVNALVGVGGTVVNLACISQNSIDHETVHATRISKSEISRIAQHLAALKLEDRRNVPGLEPARADVITAGAIIFEALLTEQALDRLTVSTRGARYGVLLEAAGISP